MIGLCGVLSQNGSPKLATSTPINFNLVDFNQTIFISGVPQIEVTFDINVDGLLSVTAKENESGKEQSVTIQGSSNLSENEIENMLEEAEKYASIDKEQKEKNDLILTATNYCQTIEEKINTDELTNCTEDDKKEIQSAISTLRELLANNSASSESIKQSFEQLQKLLEGKIN